MKAGIPVHQISAAQISPWSTTRDNVLITCQIAIFKSKLFMFLVI